jgi:hypothetical protein
LKFFKILLDNNCYLFFHIRICLSETRGVQEVGSRGPFFCVSHTAHEQEEGKQKDRNSNKGGNTAVQRYRQLGAAWRVGGVGDATVGRFEGAQQIYGCEFVVSIYKFSSLLFFFFFFSYLFSYFFYLLFSDLPGDQGVLPRVARPALLRRAARRAAVRGVYLRAKEPHAAKGRLLMIRDICISL